MKRQIPLFSEMTDEEQRRHKSLHGLRDTTWKEGGTMWQHYFGDRTWEAVHDNDHNYKRNDYAHEHK